jgi:hypothetical protein
LTRFSARLKWNIAPAKKTAAPKPTMLLIRPQVVGLWAGH